MEIDILGPLVFTTAAALPDQNIAIPGYVYIFVNGGRPQYTFSLAPGSAMPPGLTFQNSGYAALIQGTPTAPGSYSFTIQVSDSFSPSVVISQTFTLNVLNNLVLPQTSLPDAVINLPYQAQIQPAGGTPPYHFVLGQNSPLPPGLKLNSSTGMVTGTPTATVNQTMLVLISDSAPTPTTINPLINLNVQPPLSIQNAAFPDSARGLYYGVTLFPSGGRAPYAAQIVSGALPAGLTISLPSNGSFIDVQGVTTTNGLFNFTLQVSDSYQPANTVRQSFQVRISDQMTMTGPSVAQLLYNQSYTTAFPVTGGFPPYTWSMNPVPPGFTFDTSTGTLNGTPAPNSVFTSTLIAAHDSSNPPLQANYVFFQLYVAPKLTIMTTSLPPIAAGRAAWFGLQTTGGGAPFTWSFSGTLPAGMSFDTNAGVLSGTPTTPGSYPVTFSLSDSGSGNLHQTTSQALTITVKDPTQLQRNDSFAGATPLSSISLLASISPYYDPITSGPDTDVYRVSAPPGAQVYLYVVANNDFLQPPNPNSMLPVLEVVDANGVRFQTCTQPGYSGGNLPFNNPCVNGLTGGFYPTTYFGFQVPGSGTAPVTFYLRVSDARGDARPDFIYTLTVSGVN